MQPGMRRRLKRIPSDIDPKCLEGHNPRIGRTLKIGVLCGYGQGLMEDGVQVMQDLAPGDPLPEWMVQFADLGKLIKRGHVALDGVPAKLHPRERRLQQEQQNQRPAAPKREEPAADPVESPKEPVDLAALSEDMSARKLRSELEKAGLNPPKAGPKSALLKLRDEALAKDEDDQ